MARVLSVAASAAVALAIVAGAVFGVEDRSTTVPAPEAVAEGLLRQLQTHRETQTSQFLSDDARQVWPPDRLRRWWDALERKVGRVDSVSGEGHELRGDTAEARVQLRAGSHQAEIRVKLQRKNGLWRVSELPPS